MVGLKKLLGNSVVILCFMQIVGCGSDDTDISVISSELSLTEKAEVLDSYLSDLNA
jgi:hypothetical protein